MAYAWDALQRLEQEIRALEDLRDVEEVRLEDPALEPEARPRVAALQRQLRELLQHQQRLQSGGAEDPELVRAAVAAAAAAAERRGAAEVGPVEEARIPEVYETEVRTSFLHRRDCLRLRIAKTKRPGDVADFFDKGRRDHLQTYTATMGLGGVDEEVCFYGGRGDGIASYTRARVAAGQETQQVFTVGYGSDGAVVGDLPVELVTREVALSAGRSLDVLGDTPTTLRGMLSRVEEAFALGAASVSRVARYRKDYVMGVVTAWIWPAEEWEARGEQRQRGVDIAGGADSEPVEVHTFSLDASGQLSGCKGAGSLSDAEVAAEYEDILRLEAAALRCVLGLERELARFAGGHRAGCESDTVLPYDASVHARLAAEEARADALFAAVDALDDGAVAGGRKGAAYDEMAARYEARIARLEQDVRDLKAGRPVKGAG